MSNSLAIIGGNEPYPEIFLVGYRSAFMKFGLPEEAQSILFNMWNVDGAALRSAMSEESKIDLRSLLKGCLSESSRFEFAFTVFVAPEMYYWCHTIGVWPTYGRLISPVEAIKFYAHQRLLPNQSIVHVGVVGSDEAIRLYTEVPDCCRETRGLNYVFYGPDTKLVAQLTTMRYAKSPPASELASEVCITAIEDILENHYPVDIILLADLQTESWYKRRFDYITRISDVEFLTGITGSLYDIERITGVTYSRHDDSQMRNIIVLSATQALMYYAAYLTSRSMIPDYK